MFFSNVGSIITPPFMCKALPEKSADQSTWANWFLNSVDDEDVKNFVHNSEDAQKIVYLLGTKVQSTSKEQVCSFFFIFSA